MLPDKLKVTKLPCTGELFEATVVPAFGAPEQAVGPPLMLTESHHVVVQPFVLKVSVTVKHTV